MTVLPHGSIAAGDSDVLRQRFEGLAAIVTGSSRGIGRAIAMRLAREGASVVLNARNADAMESAAAEIIAAGGRAVMVVGSVAEDQVPGHLVEASRREFGRIDLVVNNVGISPYYGPLMQVDRERFARTMVSNTWPAIALVQAAVAGGLCDAGGAVLNVSTVGAQLVHPFVAPYTSSKAALDVLTKSMARELARRKVRVNGIAPGLVRTKTSRVVSEGPMGDSEATLVPLGRLGDPDDIARAAAFLLSADAAWITGVTLVVDGGRVLIGGEPSGEIGVFEPPRSTSGGDHHAEQRIE